jgi:hypothetical protein
VKKTLLINIAIVVSIFTGCTASKEPTVSVKENTKKDNQIFKSKLLAKIAIDATPNYPLPYVQKSKYIKILILPFENSENDIDYGGIIETKLEDSKFIFDDNLKKKIIKKNNSIGSI